MNILLNRIYSETKVVPNLHEDQAFQKKTVNVFLLAI